MYFKILPGLLVFSLFSFTTITTVPDSAPPKWKFISDKIVAYGVDHDVLHVTGLNDNYRQIKLHVTDAPLNIIDMKVYFENDEVFDIAIKSEFRQGG